MAIEDLLKESMEIAESQSPFRGAVTLKFGAGGTKEFTRVLVDMTTDDAEVKEYGVELQRVIECSLPKADLLTRPTNRDYIIYAGYKAKVVAVDGHDDCSPFWLVRAVAPL